MNITPWEILEIARLPRQRGRQERAGTIRADRRRKALRDKAAEGDANAAADLFREFGEICDPAEPENGRTNLTAGEHDQ